MVIILEELGDKIDFSQLKEWLKVKPPTGWRWIQISSPLLTDYTYSKLTVH